MKISKSDFDPVTRSLSLFFKLPPDHILFKVDVNKIKKLREKQKQKRKEKQCPAEIAALNFYADWGLKMALKTGDDELLRISTDKLLELHHKMKNNNSQTHSMTDIHNLSSSPNAKERRLDETGSLKIEIPPVKSPSKLFSCEKKNSPLTFTPLSCSLPSDGSSISYKIGRDFPNPESPSTSPAIFAPVASTTPVKTDLPRVASPPLPEITREGPSKSSKPCAVSPSLKASVSPTPSAIANHPYNLREREPTIEIEPKQKREFNPLTKGRNMRHLVRSSSPPGDTQNALMKTIEESAQKFIANLGAEYDYSQLLCQEPVLLTIMDQAVTPPPPPEEENATVSIENVIRSPSVGESDNIIASNVDVLESPPSVSTPSSSVQENEVEIELEIHVLDSSSGDLSPGRSKNPSPPPIAVLPPIASAFLLNRETENEEAVIVLDEERELSIHNRSLTKTPDLFSDDSKASEALNLSVDKQLEELQLEENAR